MYEYSEGLDGPENLEDSESGLDCIMVETRPDTEDELFEYLAKAKLDIDYVAEAKADTRDNGYRNLFAGILIQGIKDLTGPSKQYRDTAREWLFGSMNTHVSSFENVCDILDLNTKKTREKIKRFIAV